MVNIQEDTDFLLKLIACICNFLVLILWTVTDSIGIPVRRFCALVVFYHANCAYNVILIVLVVLYLLDEPIGGWGQRLFIGIGVVLFLLAGVIGLFDQLNFRTGNGLVSAILLIVCGVLLLVDLLKSENVF